MEIVLNKLKLSMKTYHRTRPLVLPGRKRKDNVPRGEWDHSHASNVLFQSSIPQDFCSAENVSVK